MLNLVGKVVEALAKPGWEKLKRQDRVLAVLQKLGFQDSNPPADFEGVYAHALVHYGVDKPEAVLELFRHSEVVNDFREAFIANDKAALTTATAKFMTWNRLGDELRREGTDVQRELIEFFDAFCQVAIKSQTPALAHLNHLLVEVKALQAEILRLQEQIQIDLARYRPEDLERSEARYRQLALDSCDIIDLAGLPEQDRHVAMKKFVMRQLYVPLRLQPEAQTVEQPESLEADRTFRRRREAGWLDRNVPENALQSTSLGGHLLTTRRVVVLGDPGGGKSTLVRWLATAYLLRLKQDPYASALPDVETLPTIDFLPIVIRCRDLDHGSLSGALDDMLRQTLRKAEMDPKEAEVLPAVLRQRLSRGTAILLIDGLDEITDARIRIRFCQQIESIALAFPTAPIVITSRIVGYREMGLRIREGFLHTTLADLSVDDKNTFARRWCELTEPAERRDRSTKELIQDIHSTDRIERLTGNPMLLTTMALVKRKVGNLPSRRAELYREAVQVLLNWRREVDEPLDPREALPQLQYLAYEMCRRGEQSLVEFEVLELLERMRHDYPNIRPLQKHTPEQFLKILEQRTSLLIESGQVRRDGQMERVYEFRHLTFQEYLAGLALLQGRFPGHDRSRSVADRLSPLVLVAASGVDDGAVSSHWREALRLCIASCDNDDATDDMLKAILTPIIGEDELQTGRVRALLAGLCLADEPNVSAETGQQVLTALCKNIQRNDGSGTVQTGMDKTCMELATSEWGTTLQKLLIKEFTDKTGHSKDAYGGLFAMMSAPIISSKTDVPLNEALRNFSSDIKSENEYSSICAALSIMQIYFAEKMRIVQEKAPPSIEQPLTIQIINSLLNMLQQTTSAAHASGWALIWIINPRDRERIPFINTEIPNITNIIISSLDRRKSDGYIIRFLPMILAALGAEAAIEPLSMILYDEEIDARLQAVRALGKFENERAQSALKRCLSDPDSQIRREAMGEITNHQFNSQPEFLKMLSVDLDGITPWLDPQDVIDEQRVDFTAIRLNRPSAEVKQMYEALREALPLKLAWNLTTASLANPANAT